MSEVMSVLSQLFTKSLLLNHFYKFFVKQGYRSQKSVLLWLREELGAILTSSSCSCQDGAIGKIL